MKLTLLIVLSALLGIVIADKEWLPGERASLEELRQRQLEAEWTEWLKQKLQLEAVARARSDSPQNSPFHQPQWEPFGNENAAPDKGQVAADKKWHDNLSGWGGMDRALPVGKPKNAPSNDADSDFEFAVGPDDPKFFDQPAGVRPSVEEKTRSGQEEGQGQQDIDIDGDGRVGEDSEESEDDGKSLPVVQVPIHGTEAAGALTPLAFIAIVAACCAAGVFVIALLGICSFKLQKKAAAAADVEYPAYGVTGPSKDLSPGSSDKRLAQSAHMYHYQHQKQQIIAMERASNERRGSMSEPESEDDIEEGDHIVYECPGLASTREMEVKNPLFLDDATPASPAKQPPSPSTSTRAS